MPAYVVTIGGSTKKFRHETLDIVATVNGIDVLNAEVVSLDGSYRPALGDEVVITEDGTRIFGGIVQSVSEAGAGGITTGPISCALMAHDFSTYASRRYVTATLAAGTLKSMLTTLVTDYLPGSVILHASQVNGPSLPELTYTETRLNEVLDDLAARSGYVWNIDYNEDLRMVAFGEMACPFNVVDGDGHAVGDVTVEASREDTYANVVYVRVTGAGPATSTETFVAADGVSSGSPSKTRFTVKYPASASINDMWTNVLTFDGVIQGPIGFGPDQLPGGTNWYWDYTVSPAQLVYPDGSGTAFPTGAQEISITYAIRYPFTVSTSDAAAIAAVGRVEVIVPFAEAVTIEAAEDIAATELTRRLATQRTVRYSTERVDVLPGQTQTVTLATRALNDSFLVTEVRTVNVIGGVLWRHVTAIESTVYQGSWRNTYRDWMGGGGGGGGSLLSSTGGGGGTAAPPERAVQHRSNGVFEGDEDFKYSVTQSLNCGPSCTVSAGSIGCQAFGDNCHTGGSW